MYFALAIMLLVEENGVADKKPPPVPKLLTTFSHASAGIQIQVSTRDS